MAIEVEDWQFVTEFTHKIRGLSVNFSFNELSIYAHIAENTEYLILTEAANTIKFNYTNTAIDDGNTLVKSFSLS